VLPDGIRWSSVARTKGPRADRASVGARGGLEEPVDG